MSLRPEDDPQIQANSFTRILFRLLSKNGGCSEQPQRDYGHNVLSDIGMMFRLELGRLASKGAEDVDHCYTMVGIYISWRGCVRVSLDSVARYWKAPNWAT